MRSVPRLGEATKLKEADIPLPTIAGSVPPLTRLPPGCPFSPRCPNRFDPCDKAVPGWTILRSISDSRYPISDASGSGNIGHRASDIPYGTGSPHEARCYLYSRAIDPETLPEDSS
jgi:oligopeptide/dipeptide ABC transporter ATP-binding protein